ncbi:MAG: altronate dehydratase [Bryobacteraceae bacterium]|nr:altronate dehydratase [Bryobacteraceae bacterium]
MDQIVKLPTAHNAVIHLHHADNVAVARVPLTPGLRIVAEGRTVTVQDPVPPGHKVALEPIGDGEQVTRWGQMIGRAGRAIEPGRHVHVHNVVYEERAAEYELPSGDIPLRTPPASAPAFLGYPREDGRVGTRNYIAVVAASNCAAFTVNQVARLFENEKFPPGVDGVAAFPLDGGCSIPVGAETDLLKRTLSGILHHPNVSGAVLVGLGCEVNQVSLYFPDGQSRTERVVGLTLQGAGGTKAAVEAARREVWKLVERAASEKRVETPAASLVLGLQCGGSDSFSGITANPALGHCSDLLIDYGGAAVLAETPECFGAEHLLAGRARNRGVAEKFLGFVDGYKDYLRRFGCNFDDNPTPGNKEGGLTTILEKSLGAAAKAGVSPLTDAVDYGEPVTTSGFVFMNTPGNDPISLAGLAAGGANIMAFTTGRGSASGFPIVPVIKIASNSHTFRNMPDDMDVNAGRIADGEASVEQVGREIFDLALRVASGEETSSERLGHNEFVVWRIGPVL